LPPDTLFNCPVQVLFQAFIEFTMGYLNKKVILKYLYDQLTGNFMGFLIGLSATSLVSRFFETRSLRNLWGLSSKKTVVDKETFANLEWIISIIVGFVVFEIITKIVKEKIDRYFPTIRTKVYRFIITNNLKAKLASITAVFQGKRIVLFASVYGSIKNTFTKFSKR
jgi:hypothetical protein